MKKALVGFLSFIAPGRVANYAYQMLTHPQVKKLRPRELAFMETGERQTVSFQQKKLVTYSWANQGPTILLIHGWEGQAGNFTDIIQSLHSAGFTIITLDAPAHGFSEAGSTSLWAFGDAVIFMMEKHNPRFLLSHSFGGVATVYALKKIASHRVERYLLLCPPDSFNERIDQVAASVGISNKVKEKLKDQLRTEVDEPLEALSVSNYVKDFSIAQVSIIHDEQDKVVPIAQSLRVASNWENASHETIHGTGHFRILRDEGVLSRITSFFSEKE